LKFLILTAAFGTGHNQVAEALEEAATREGNTAEVYDWMASGFPALSSVLTRGFLQLLSTAPSLYRMAYSRAEFPGPVDGFKHTTLGAIGRLLWPKLALLMARVQPDVILCTHPFPLGVMTILRRRYQFQAPVMGVLTDFASHSFWIHEGVNQYYVASQKMVATMVAQGVAPHRVHATGIPIRETFAEPPNREDAAITLGLDPKRPTVLLMGGGLGMGPMREMVTEACKVSLPLQVLVVTGHNQRLYEELQTLAARLAGTSITLRLFGYVPYIHTLMAASDLLVTKAGAVTASEALAMGLPMLLLHPIPGHEERNQSALVATGAAREIASPADIPQTLHQFFTDRLDADRMHTAAIRAGQPHAARNLIRLVVDTRLEGVSAEHDMVMVGGNLDNASAGANPLFTAIGAIWRRKPGGTGPYL
jgi:processive 1,2-diacylglycerol beta-glucosyltransferase